MSGVYDKLAATALALIMLLASVNIAIFLERLGSTLKTRDYHPHGHLPPPASRFVLLAIQDREA